MIPIKNTNFKSLLAVTVTLMVLFGVFYYLITDISNKPSSSLSSQVKKPETSLANTQKVLSEASELKDNNQNNETENSPKQQLANTSENNEPVSSFAVLASKKVDAQPQVVLGAADENAPQSTVPETGVEMIFFAFVASTLMTFYGVYLLTSQKREAALSKFEQRIIKDLD